MSFDTCQPSYHAFRRIVAERTKRLVVWTGAGLSQPAGLPLWGELRAELTQAARQQARARKEHADHELAAIAAVERIESHWTAFERLHDILTEPTYASLIRRCLAKADDSHIPSAYTSLWKLPIWSMITTNLDRFAARAFSETRPGDALNEIDAGDAAGQYGPILQGNTPIVVNAHGVLANRSTWVFTKSEIEKLLSNEAYKTFIHSIMTTASVLFIGTSADDVASGGFLARLLQSGFVGGEHFWLTSRTDDRTRDWANIAGIQAIYYSAETGHEKPLSSFFADLHKFRSVDEIAPPVRHAGPAFPSKAIDKSDPPNEIRRSLAGLVDAALDGSNPVSVIRSIAKTYELEIHNAWFVSVNHPNNQYFSYTIEDKISDGGFGRVYRAKDSDGNDVAIKILRQEILDNEDLVGSFRRGVRSMSILSERKVDGMVPYLNAFELPPTVVMGFVNGPDLQELRRRGDLTTLDEILKVAFRVAEIVHGGHSLPERVLHRDIRPANIMIRDYYTTGDISSVVVLDFDLSWHKGSQERSIDLSSVGTMGYFAPELVSRSSTASTRNTAVDVYGLAMTMYFMLSGTHPQLGMNFSEEWKKELSCVVKRYDARLAWKSAGNRLIRLMLSATSPEQAKRPDMPSMIAELRRLSAVVAATPTTGSAELLCEEIAARAGGWREYTWDPATLSCSFRLGSGVIVVLGAREVEGLVLLKVSYTETGQSERRGVARYIAERCTEAASRIRAVGWEHVVDQSDEASMGIEADVKVAKAKTSLDALAAPIAAAMERLGMH